MRYACFYLLGGGALPANADYSLTLSLTVANASASTTTSSDYALIIPDSFTITKSGWNEITDGITAKVSGDNATFDSGYKLTVTAATDSTLTAEGITDTIGYTLKAVSTDASATTAWEFTADELNASKDSVITGTTKTLGVDVADYSKKANGDYTDTITFTAEVKAALLSLNVDNYTIYYVEGETWGQAIANHPTENSSWYVSLSNEILYQGVNGFVVDSGGGVLTPYSKINSNLTYKFAS